MISKFSMVPTAKSPSGTEGQKTLGDGNRGGYSSGSNYNSGGEHHVGSVSSYKGANNGAGGNGSGNGSTG